MKKLLKVDIIVALALFLAFFIAETVIFYKLNDSEAAGFVSYTALIITVFIVAILVVITSARFAGIYHKSIKDYILRMLGQIVLLVVLGVAFTLVSAIVVEPFFGMPGEPLIERVGNKAVITIVELILLVIYLAAVYKFYVKTGYLHSGAKRFNFTFQALTVIYAFMLIIPPAIKDSMYIAINPHSALVPNTPAGKEGFNLLLMSLSLAVTIAAEMFIMIFAYNRGKKIFMKQRMRQTEAYETDELAG